MNISFVAWAHYNRRSELLAQHLGASMHHISYGKKKIWLQLPLRYVVQARQMWQVLRQEQPEVIFVQNPPIFCALIAAIYSWRFKARYVIDSHTGAFSSPKWKWAIPIHRLLSKWAITTIVTNQELKNVVNGWGCRAFILGFTPGEYPEGEQFPFEGKHNIAVPSTFESDEPLDVIFEAASRVPHIHFYVTGKSELINPRYLAMKPDNCHLTGFIPYSQYVGLLKGADAVLDLVTRDNTLLLGAFEAVSLGTPMILSDWQLLKDYFSRGAVHVPNTVDGVMEGVRRAIEDQTALRQDVLVLQQHLQKEWETNLAELLSLVSRENSGKRALSIGIASE